MGCLCGEEAARKVLDVRNFSIVECKSCKLVRTEPKPTIKYENESPPERDVQAEALWKKFSFNILSQIKQFKKSGKLLDIGCGRGFLIYWAQKAGYQARGIEISKSDAEYGEKFLGVNIRAQDLFTAKPSEKYDVIVLNHVVEHVEDPVPLLKRLKEFLADDGIIYIGLPNYKSGWRMVQGKNWYPYQPEQHYWHYTPQTLSRVCLSAGLRIRKIIKTSVEHSIVMLPFTVAFEIAGLGDNMALIASK